MTRPLYTHETHLLVEDTDGVTLHDTHVTIRTTHPATTATKMQHAWAAFGAFYNALNMKVLELSIIERNHIALDNPTRNRNVIPIVEVPHVLHLVPKLAPQPQITAEECIDNCKKALSDPDATNYVESEACICSCNEFLDDSEDILQSRSRTAFLNR